MVTFFITFTNVFFIFWDKKRVFNVFYIFFHNVYYIYGPNQPLLAIITKVQTIVVINVRKKIKKNVKNAFFIPKIKKTFVNVIKKLYRLFTCFKCKGLLTKSVTLTE